MWHDMFSLSVPVLEKVLRTVFVYALVVLLFRLTGKRGLASMNTFDFVVIFLLSNFVQNAIIGADNSLTGRRDRRSGTRAHPGTATQEGVADHGLVRGDGAGAGAGAGAGEPVRGYPGVLARR